MESNPIMCPGCGRDLPRCNCDPWEVECEHRYAAQAALARWIADCGPNARTAHAAGSAGYIGRIVIHAFASDDGITLRVERSFTEAL